MAPVAETPAVESEAIVATETPVDAEEAKAEVEEAKIVEPTFADADVTFSEADLSAMDALVSTLEQDLETATATVSAKDAEIASLKAKLEELYDGTGDAATELEAKNARIKELEESVKTVEEAWQMIQSHPQIGKLSEALVRGEQIDLSESLVAYLEQEMGGLVDTGATTPTPPVVAKKMTGGDMIRNAKL